MTDDELEKMGFIKQIQLPSGPIIDLHSEYFIKKDRLKAGVEGAEHKHPDNEHCWYILSGTGTMHILGESYKLGPEMAIFAPADVLHKIDVDPDEDLTYVLIYAPGGPEQKLIEKGAHAFDDE